jgi:hypothetical protein
LVIGVLCHRNVFHTLKTWVRFNRVAQGAVTCSARCIFWALTLCILRIDFANDQWNLQAITQLLTMRCKMVGSLLQAMVNVNRTNLPRPLLRASAKQRRGIGTTAESNGHGQFRLKAVGQQAHGGATHT